MSSLWKEIQLGTLSLKRNMLIFPEVLALIRIPFLTLYTTNQDNVGEPPIQEIVPEEQTLTPQEPMPLRRSTRERRSAVPDNYVVFLQEHEVDIGVM